MGREATDASRALAHVVVARRGQFFVRLSFAILVAIVFYPLTSPIAATLWLAGYTLVQIAERATFRNVEETPVLSRPRMVSLVAVLFVSNVVFASYGILEAFLGGTWGIVCAGLLWSGAILSGAMVSGRSRLAFAALILPPLAAFLPIPALVVEHGGSLGEGIAVLIGGGLNAVAALLIWASYSRLMISAAHGREAARLALLDPDTGLPNRHAMQLRIAELKRGSGDRMIVVAAICIDRFEQLHGTIGYPLTLALVSEIAKRLDAAHPAVVARLSGRMLGMAWRADDMQEARAEMKRVLKAMQAPFVLQDNMVDVSVTIGLATLLDPARSDPSAEISTVDRAMIAVEHARRSQVSVAFFDPEIYGDPAANLSLMSDMLAALRDGHISVQYQPKLELRTGRILGVEALVRWMHPQRGLIASDDFIPLAEETAHIGTLTEWVVLRVIEDQRAMVAEGFPLSISINLSGRLIDDTGFTRRLLGAIRDAEAPICLELTETAIIGSPERARIALESFKAAGIGISIDDYGSGLSSLAYLRNIRADELKIDKSFVLNIARSHTDAMLVRSAIELGHSLGIRVVAEGVESHVAVELLKLMNCDFAQGYGIARPMPPSGLTAFLRDRDGDPTAIPLPRAVGA